MRAFLNKCSEIRELFFFQQISIDTACIAVVRPLLLLNHKRRLSFRYALFMLEKANRDWIKVLNYHQEPPLIPAV